VYPCLFGFPLPIFRLSFHFEDQTRDAEGYISRPKVNNTSLVDVNVYGSISSVIESATVS
jgi:hypothetical protein